MAQLLREFSNAGLGLMDFFEFFFNRLMDYSITIPGTPISSPETVSLFSLLAVACLTTYLLDTIIVKWVLPG